MVYKEQLSNIYKDMREQKRRLEKERDVLPEGYLTVRTYKGRQFYTWQIPKGGRRKKVFRKGITRDKEQISKLVRKRYLDGALANIDEDICLMEDVLTKYKGVDEAAVMSSYIRKHPELKEGLRYGLISDKEWAADYKQALDLYKENLKSTSASGAPMRSHGELIIASRLEFYGIPYRYEERIDYKGVKRVPDFKIRRPKDGKIFYWEHMGRRTAGSM